MFASRFANVAGVTAKSYARQMSAVRGTPAEMRADTMRWRNISIAMCFVTTGTCVYVYLNPEEHVAQNPKLPYWKNRTKPYPWKECSDCGFLDMPCWIECRKENKAKEDMAKGVTNEGGH